MIIDSFVVIHILYIVYTYKDIMVDIVVCIIENEIEKQLKQQNFEKVIESKNIA